MSDLKEMTVEQLRAVVTEAKTRLDEAKTRLEKIQPPGTRFDAYGGIVSSNGVVQYSFSLRSPYVLQKGLKPIALKAVLNVPFSKALYINSMIPPGIEGTYSFFVGLVPSGKKPAVRNAIPGYLWQGTVDVAP
jgi:hypothetical protein